LQQEIEQRKRAEEALLQSQKMEAIGQLTGGVAHDFNNLLMVVQSGLRLMERHSDPVRRAATVEAMRQALERGAGLTRQLLALARRQTLKLEAIDLAMHLRGMRELLARSLRADILVDINTARDLWPVKTDPTQFEVAILNLAVNARDAMPKGGVLTVSAKNETRPDGEFVEIRVSDTGLGMPADVLLRVFEPYFTTKQIGQGTGLGLSQFYGIVSQSGGNIRIESVTNEGTSVIVLLPRSNEPAAKLIAAAANDPLLNHIAGKSVLVVEDDDAVANAVDEMLREMGCTPTRVASAQAALNAVEERCTYDLIFSDIVMPGAMNGVDLACELHKRYPNTPIVLTSGFSGTATLDASFPVLRKLYKFEDLVQVVSRVTAPRASESA
jgi:CheY-like chemotaxis protein